MLSDLLQPIGEALFEIVFYYFGRVFIPLISFGNWFCEPLFSNVPKQEKRFGGLLRYRKDKIYFTSEGTACVGAVVCLLAVGVSILIWYGARK